MKISDTQATILVHTTAKTKMTAGECAEGITGIPAGPTARSLNALVGQGLMKVTEKQGINYYSRTADGGKVAKQYS